MKEDAVTTIVFEPLCKCNLGTTLVYVLIRLVRAQQRTNRDHKGHGPPVLGILHARPYRPYWAFLVRASCFVLLATILP